MADNVNVTAGTGTIVHADEYTHGTLGSGKTQLVKLVDGTLDSDTPIVVDIGAKANALRVAPANDITDGTYIGDIKFGESLVAGTNLIGKVGIDQTTPGTTNRVDIGALIPGVGATNLGKAEDAGHSSGDTGVMALTVRQNTAAALSGADADYQPLITDTNGRLHVLDANSANMLTALQLIDDAIYIDDADWSDGSSKHLLVGGLYQSTPQTITDGDVAPLEINVNGSLRVTDANITACNTGAVVLSSGTVTTVSTVTNLAQLGGTAITMDEGVHDAGCQRVTIATDDDGVAHLATIAGDTTAIETAIEIMDDWDATHASAAPTDGALVMGAAYNTALPTDVGADADAARLVTDRYGRLCTGLQPQAAKATLDNADTTTAREIVAATASRKIYITSLILSVDTAGNYWLEDGDATAVTGKFYLAAKGGVAQTFPEGTPLNTPVVNKALNVKGSTAGNVSVTITYYLAV